MAFPVIVENLRACGIRDGRRVSTSIIPAVSVLLVARGADKLIVPAPHQMDRECAEIAIDSLPSTRRGLVKLADTNGAVWNRVLTYMEPFRSQVKKWPETAFIGFAKDFLYKVLLASKYHAGILADDASVTREFLPILNPKAFRGEARYRLAEIARIICGYKPGITEHGTFSIETSHDVEKVAWDVIRTAEFRAVTASWGRIGYLQDPFLAIDHATTQLRKLIRRPSVKAWIGLATTAVDAVGGGSIKGIAGDALDVAIGDGEGAFNPPFISLGPAELPLYCAALREGAPGAIPPKGKIMLFEDFIGGRPRYSWLSKGQERELEREAKTGLRHRQKNFEEAQKSLQRLVA